MAILRSIDGKFYEIEDESLAAYELDADRVKEVMGAPLAAPPTDGFDEAPQVVIEIIGGEPALELPPPGSENGDAGAAGAVAAQAEEGAAR